MNPDASNILSIRLKKTGLFSDEQLASIIKQARDEELRGLREEARLAREEMQARRRATEEDAQR